MKCSKCNGEIDKSAIFCPKCGSQVEKQVASFCSNCGAETKQEDKFCKKCGNSLLSSVSSKPLNISDNMKNEAEKELLTVKANLFRGIEGVGGKLVITNKRLVFTSHKLNIQTGSTTIQISDIVEAYPKNLGGMVPTGMCVKTTQGVEYKFVVYNRTKILALINSLMQK